MLVFRSISRRIGETDTTVTGTAQTGCS
jgi:hypothetical protein